jgi:hypothetical protein
MCLRVCFVWNNLWVLMWLNIFRYCRFPFNVFSLQ